VNWWEAYAFCIWDGGFLPSEAEWEYAAAGGSDQREFPWGSTDPGSSNQYAIYDKNYCSVSSLCIAPVGTATLGAGRWGQLDLAGELWEWTLDWYAASYVEPCVDCAVLTVPPTATLRARVVRGGTFEDGASYMQPSFRIVGPPVDRNYALGWRCARAP
jgi:formylglycine-generating enzyme required for sulfatase activity